MSTEKPEETQKEPFLKTSPVFEIKLFGGIIVTIVCLALGLVAYTKLAEITGDVFDIVDNWETEPAVNMSLPVEGTLDCPVGFEAISLEKSKFSGMQKGHCACSQAYGNYNPETETPYYSSAGNCSDAAELTQYCQSFPGQSGFGVRVWRNRKVCFKRGGLSAASWDDGYSRRPTTDSDGNCPSDFKKCGRGNYNKNYATCWPVSEPCPVSAIVVGATVGGEPTSGQWENVGDFGDGTSLYIRRDHVDETPAVDFEVHLTQYSSSDYLDGDSYTSARNDRGPCYTGSPQRFPTSKIRPSSESYWYYNSPSFPSKCRREDERFSLFDRVGLEDHFLNNLNYSSECEGFELYPVDHPSYSTLTDPDYRNSGVGCDSKGVCIRSADQITDCNGDGICEVLVNQNLCGQYTRAIRSLHSDSNSFGMYYRGEIPWRDDCPVTMDDIYRNLYELRASVDAQLAGVIISWVLGMIFGVILPLTALFFADNGHRVSPEIEALLTHADPFLHVIKLAPLLAAIIFIGRIWRVYRRAGNEMCSNDLTNKTFTFLGEELPSIYRASLANVVLECILFLVAGYTLRSSYKEANAATVVPTEGLVIPPPPPQTAVPAGVATSQQLEMANVNGYAPVPSKQPEPWITAVKPKPEEPQQQQQQPPPSVLPSSLYGAPPDEQYAAAPPQQQPPPDGLPSSLYGAPPGEQYAAAAPSQQYPPPQQTTTTTTTAAPAVAAAGTVVPAHLAVAGSGQVVQVAIPTDAVAGSTMQIPIANGCFAQFTVPFFVKPGTVINITV